MLKLRISRRTIGLTIVLISFSTMALPAPLCDDESARLVARAYVLSIPLFFQENDLIPLMAENKNYFLEGGNGIRCMQALGLALMQGGLAAGSQNKDYAATERFGGSMPDGLAHLPGQVDKSMRAYGSDEFTMGQELYWLSQVLPLAAEGNYEPYKTTGTPHRQMIIQILPTYQMLCQIDPGVCQIMLGMMPPALEQQIYTLARHLSK